MRKKSKSSIKALVPVTSPGVEVPEVFQVRPDLHGAVRDYAIAAEAKNTLRARRADLRVFSTWCKETGCESMPAEPATVAAFLADQSRGGPGRLSKAVATVVRYTRSIGTEHRLRGLESPTSHVAVQRVLRGIRRERGTVQKKKRAFTAEVAVRVLGLLKQDASPREVRDRAIVLLGLASALRRSEIAALDVEDLTWADRGVIVRIRRSKTDQEGRGRVVAVPRYVESENYCPVRALERWLEISGTKSGPLFHGRRGRVGDKTVALAVKHAVGNADALEFAGHSLRAGYVTTARKNGIDWGSIMEQTGHKRVETAKGYTQFMPEVFDATRVEDVFRGAFDIRPEKAKK